MAASIAPSLFVASTTTSQHPLKLYGMWYFLGFFGIVIGRELLLDDGGSGSVERFEFSAPSSVLSFVDALVSLLEDFGA